MLHPVPDPNQPNVYFFLSIYLYTCLSIYLCIYLGLPRWLSGKESACNVGDASSILGSRRFPGEGTETHSSILVWESHGQRCQVAAEEE